MVTNYHNWWLASPRDALYSPIGLPVVKRVDGSAGRHVKQEADFQINYVTTPQISNAGEIGHIFPGEFLKKATAGAAYTFSFMMLTYAF